MELHAITWNLFHGRDFPPDPTLLTWRSRLLRITERGATHAQVNRPLRPSSPPLIAAANWDVALFQESPSALVDAVGRARRAQPHTVRSPRATRSARSGRSPGASTRT